MWTARPMPRERDCSHGRCLTRRISSPNPPSTRRRTMQRLSRAATVLVFPAIAYLGAACERTETPTQARRPGVAFDLSNNPTTLWVNAAAIAPIPPGTSCDNPGYRTIQRAVDDATTGDRINVCPGTYVEQVTIPAGKDNIRLRSTRQWTRLSRRHPIILWIPLKQ